MPWADDLSSCITDVIAGRAVDPLRQLAHFLSQPSARPDWEETASAYTVRHNLEQRLGAALDAAGLTALQEETPADAINRLCLELRRRAPSDRGAVFGLRGDELRNHRYCKFTVILTDLLKRTT